MEYLRKIIRNYYFYLLLILLLAAFFRLYQLGSIPAGLLNDEANKGYDAYSLLLTGKDQWGAFLPLTNLRGFGDYPPPLYQYLSIVPIALLGLSAFSVRVVSAFAGVTSVLAIFFVGRKLFNEKVGLYAALLLAILPWAVGLSRVGMEANLAIPLLLIALFFGIKNYGKHTLRNLIISSLFLAVTLYTYSAFTLFAPLVFVVILFDNFSKKLGIKKIFIPIILFGLIALPLFINKGSASVRFSQVGLTTNVNSIGLLDNLNMQIGQCKSQYAPVLCKIADNKVVLFSSVFAKNYLAHFSPNFLYVNGTVTQYSILQERGLDYIFASVLLILGLYYLLKINPNKKVSLVLILLFLLAPIPDSLTGDGNFSRASMMQPMLVLIDAIGLYYLISILSLIKKFYIKALVISLVSFVVVFSVFSFLVTYTTYFKNNYSIYSQYGYQDLMQKVYSERNNYDRIYISKHLNDTKQYIYYLFYERYNPEKFQNKVNVSYSLTSDGWSSIDKIDNIYFVQNPPAISSDSALTKQKILIISTPVDFPKSIKPVFDVKDKLGNVIFMAVDASDLLYYKW
jgi:4-amino-4-deoxy-L-arabinose transferase-like glycosyltransferase